MLEYREEIRNALLRAGVGQYAAQALAQGLAGDGRVYALVVAERAEMWRGESAGAVPARGEVVQVQDWQLLVDFAAFGEGKVAMTGLQGGNAQAEWSCAPLMVERAWLTDEMPAMPGEARTVASMAEFEEAFAPPYTVPSYGTLFEWPREGLWRRWRRRLARWIEPRPPALPELPAPEEARNG